MTRLVAALFAVFAVALFVVPAEHAAAQTSPCATGTTATTSSGKCVANAALAAANNCESAGWSLNTAGTHCEIPSTDVDVDGETPDDCQLSGGPNVGTNNGDKVGCEHAFSDRDGDGTPDFPQYNAALDNPTPRRFVNHCYLGQDPVDENTAGETQCCTSPTTDHDMRSDTPCQATAETCADKDANAIPNPDASPPLTCVCNPETHEGTPSEGCTLPPRAVTVSASANGKVSATWPGLATAVAEGESGEAPANVTITVSAEPDAGFYVTVWTGACESSTNVGSADDGAVLQTCEVDPGTSDATVGAVFAEATCPGGQKPTAMSGTCLFPGPNDINLKVADNCESAGWPVTVSAGATSARTQYCKLPFYGNEGDEGDQCELDESWVAGCHFYFADNDNDGVTDFPAPVSDGSGGNRRFITNCQNPDVITLLGDTLGAGPNTSPHPQNDKGQTHCCPAGTTDADQDPSTDCTEPIGDIAIGGAIIPETGDITPSDAICSGFGGTVGMNTSGDSTCFGHIVPGRDTAETGCIISASGSCKADFEKIRECHVAEKLTKFENGVALCGGSANCDATEDLIVDECVCPASRADVPSMGCLDPTFRNCALAGKVHTVAGDGCLDPGTDTCPMVGLVAQATPDGTRCFPYCPPGKQLTGNHCSACGTGAYNPVPGGRGAASCFRCGANGVRADAATCDCNPGFAKNKNGFCVLASPRLELEGVLLSDVTVVAEGRYFVSEWVGAECAGDDAGDAGGTAVCSLGTGVGAGGVAGTVAAVFAYARAVSLGFSPTAGGTLRATMAVGGGQGLEAGEWVGVESGGRASSVEFLFFEAVPAEGYRVGSWEGCAGGAVSGGPADVGAKVCVVGPGEEDLEVRVVFEAVP